MRDPRSPLFFVHAPARAPEALRHPVPPIGRLGPRDVVAAAGEAGGERRPFLGHELLGRGRGRRTIAVHARSVAQSVRNLRILAVVVLAAVAGCGGDTESASGGAPAATCHDAAYRAEDYASVDCDEGAMVSLEDGWIVCRCNPQTPSGP